MHASRSLTAFALLVLSGHAVSAQVKVDHRYQLDMDGAVRIHNYNGSLTIRGWDKDSIRVTGTIAAKDARAWFGGGGRGSAKMGVEGNDDNAPLAELTIMVPARARLSVRGAATSIDVREFAGTIDATTLSGRLHIAGAASEILAETMDGDLDVEASPTFFRGRTAMGRVTWTGSSDDVTIVTVGGSITLAGATLYRARMESISGPIKFAGLVKPDGRVTFDSHGGDITLGFGKATVAELAYDAPRGSIFGAEFTRDAKNPGQKYVDVPKGGLGGRARQATVTASTFKGRLTVTWP
jgi:hypothetical protein